MLSLEGPPQMVEVVGDVLLPYAELRRQVVGRPAIVFQRLPQRLAYGLPSFRQRWGQARHLLNMAFGGPSGKGGGDSGRLCAAAAPRSVAP